MKTDTVAFWKGWTIGACVGVSVMTIICTFVAIKPMGDVILKMDKLVKDCESNIPRNMHCELRAEIKESE